MGYTNTIEEAGRFTRQNARGIVDKATVNGQLNETRVCPVTGRRYEWQREVAVPAPENRLVSLTENEVKRW